MAIGRSNDLAFSAMEFSSGPLSLASEPIISTVRSPNVSLRSPNVLPSFLNARRDPRSRSLLKKKEKLHFRFFRLGMMEKFILQARRGLKIFFTLSTQQNEP